MPSSKKPTNDPQSAKIIKLPRVKKSEPASEESPAVTAAVVESEPEPQQPSGATEQTIAQSPAKEIVPAARQFTKTKLIKLNREAIWQRLTKKHGLPLAKPGTTNDGVKLFTSDEGNGAAYVTYRADSIVDAVERLQFIEQQCEQCAAILLTEGFPVERVTKDGLPHLKVPVQHRPGIAEPPKKHGGRVAYNGEEFGSGI